MTPLHPFLFGALTATSAIASLFFLRFWKSTRERLFVYFCAAFATLAVGWAVLANVDVYGETRPYAYVVRLIAFAIIIAGIIDKNRRRAS